MTAFRALPAEPRLEFDRKAAKALLRALRDDDPAARADLDVRGWRPEQTARENLAERLRH